MIYARPRSNSSTTPLGEEASQTIAISVNCPLTSISPGTGNIVSNDNPDNARKAQDLDTPEHHSKEQHGTYHWGRGGEGNKMTIGDGDKKPERTGERKGSFKGAIGKAKEAVGLGKKEKKAGDDSAIAD